jgi:uncharacterized protein involved in exopolysaccharide biosynthesis
MFYLLRHHPIILGVVVAVLLIATLALYLTTPIL